MSIELPKHYKETHISKPGAIGTGIANSAKTATNYIQADSTGIRIANANPSTATTYQHQTATNTEFVVDGISRAEISGNGARFGKAYVQDATDNESHLELDYRSMRLIDKEGDEFFAVEDLRDASGCWTIAETFIGEGGPENYYFYLRFVPDSEDITVTVNGSSRQFEKDGSKIIVVYGGISDGDTIVITYETASSDAKAFTFGSRVAQSALGGLSYAEGKDVTASGHYSHAEGYDTSATDQCAHAEGYGTVANGYASHAQNYHTVANFSYQTAIGRYNKPTIDAAFVIGNGTDENHRSNAYEVYFDGTVRYQGDKDWSYFPLASGAAAYDLDSEPMYRKWGPVVALVGAVKPESQVAAGGTLTIGTLPDGCRPQLNVVQMCQGSGGNIWMLRITTAGVVTAERYRSGSTNAAIPTSAWLPFNCTFMV